MDEILDCLRSRRSIRLFQETPVTDTQINQLKEALLRAPTSRGRNPWQFILVDDPGLLKKVGAAKTHGSAFIGNAKLAFVICADETVSDVWIEDCAIAAITLQYVAHSIGLGSCWAQIRQREHDGSTSSEDYLRRILDIPAEIKISSVIGIGYPAEEKEGHPASSLPENRFHRNGYEKRG